MSRGDHPADELAYALVNAEFDFDAVERGPLRAEWTADNTAVVVADTGSGEEFHYSADDLVLATSDREVENARTPDSP